jgi:hypothetical protein
MIFKSPILFAILVIVSAGLSKAAIAAPPSAADVAKALAPHKAMYDISLIATHSGSQIINISGQMVYEVKASCDAWLTNHHFKLNYEYADMPGMRIASDFSTYESADGKEFSFSSRRLRDGELIQELRGQASVDDQKGGEAVFSMPEGLKFDLKGGYIFPMAHTINLIQKAEQNKSFYDAILFDGSDEEGPIEIATFIGPRSETPVALPKSEAVDESLLKGSHWTMRMAVFPVKAQEEISDYEMTLVFHQNGVISDMTIDYDDFSVRQKLVSLEKIAADSCGSKQDAIKLPLP